jgi:hypothetical protein
MIEMISWDAASILLIGVFLVYLYYFWIAKDEMKEKPKIKRIVWLALIPFLPIFLFIFPFYTVLILIILVAVGEASECQD